MWCLELGPWSLDGDGDTAPLACPVERIALEGIDWCGRAPAPHAQLRDINGSQRECGFEASSQLRHEYAKILEVA